MLQYNKQRIKCRVVLFMRVDTFILVILRDGVQMFLVQMFVMIGEQIVSYRFDAIDTSFTIANMP